MSVIEIKEFLSYLNGLTRNVFEHADYFPRFSNPVTTFFNQSPIPLCTKVRSFQIFNDKTSLNQKIECIAKTILAIAVGLSLAYAGIGALGCAAGIISLNMMPLFGIGMFNGAGMVINGLGVALAARLVYEQLDKTCNSSVLY